DALYSKGRTQKGNIVTNCKGSSYSSMHQWGVAFDFYRYDGKGIYDDSDGFFTKVGRIGEKIGLEWGGAWNRFVDKPHFQLPDWGSSTKRLKELYGNPEYFINAWVDSSVKISKYARPTRIKELQEALNGIQVGLPYLSTDGGYGDKTKNYLLAVWDLWGWNKERKSDGWTVGRKTMTRLKL
ncbi:MAG TPA: M15 family metallopeptidase, partial [Lachnospiraceae bacterium]|nr:M15 family metallopeptidase [Lachnospiraceae bacterium]